MASFIEFILLGHLVGSFNRCRKILDTLELFGVTTENFIIEATTADTTEATAGDTTEATAGDTTEAAAGDTSKAAAQEMGIFLL